MYLTQSPVLLIGFNRPTTTNLVLNEIAKVQPKKLYVALDGPRDEHVEDEEKCKLVKEIVSNISWDCELKTLYREKNLGCKYAVSSAISWFFEHEEMGIIVEDDCLPSPDFFRFCDQLLDHYKNDTRVRFITGCNFQNNQRINDATYYFSKLSHVWGWASWKRVWDDYDVELEKYKDINPLSLFHDIFQNELLAGDWNNIFNDLINHKINTWDYQLAICNMFNHGLSIIPNANLVSNIGIGVDSTHTFHSAGFDHLQFGKLDKQIIHPTTFLISHEADNNTLFREFNIEERMKEKKRNRFWKKIKFWKK
jgi:hypothetical protein